MSPHQHMPCLAGDPKAVRRALEDAQLTQHAKQTAAAHAAWKKARRVKS